MSVQHSDSQLYFDEPPSPSLVLSIIVPAKDEAASIKVALDALRKQFDGAGNSIPHRTYEVLVLANNCNDCTYEICRSYQASYPGFQLFVRYIELESEVAHIGTVRRMLMDAAYQRLMHVAGKRGIIVSTDADSKVDSQWVHQIRSEMDKGVDVVAGRILSKDTPSLSRTHHLRDVTYRFLKARLESEIDPCNFNPWPRHFQCFGASLAVTCEIYDRGGRLPVVPYLEDDAFRKAVNRIDAKIRHSPKVVVYTSSRLKGRVAVGFSGQLQEWARMSLNHHVQMEESFDSVKHQLIKKKQLRNVWTEFVKGKRVSTELKMLSLALGLESAELLSLLSKNTYFESLWEQVHGHMADNHRNLIQMQPVSEAIKIFRSHFANRR